MQDFSTDENFSFNQCHNKEFCVSSRESRFIKGIEIFFPVFAWPDINTRGVGRIFDSYVNPRHITVSNSPNPSRVYIRLCKHGKGFYCLNSTHWAVYHLLIS